MGADMKFTDDDLKRLKEKIKVSDDSDDETLIMSADITALLARLEASEAIVKIEDFPCRLDHSGNCQTHFVSNPCEYETWRKAKGE